MLLNNEIQLQKEKMTAFSGLGSEKQKNSFNDTYPFVKFYRLDHDRENGPI